MELKRLFMRIVLFVMGITAALVLLSSQTNHPATSTKEKKPKKSTAVKLNKKGRIPARQRIEMRLEEAADSDRTTRAPLEYPDWWRRAWESSEVSGNMNKFVGDRPLFAASACKSKRTSSANMYDFVEAGSDFLQNSKNPCWYEKVKQKKVFKCAPYFYLAGVAKGGTTDMFKRIRMHPDVLQGTQKEYHWWDRYRFGNTESDDDMGPKQESTSFDEYLEQITGPELKLVENDILNVGQSVKVFGDGSPSYLWDVGNWDMLEGNQGCDEPRVTVGQHIRHLYPDAKIIMTFRHPTPRLYSRFLSRIPRTPQLKGATNQDFHKYVVRGIEMYEDCFKKFSIRRCAYNDTLHEVAFVRLVEGMYPVFLADWFRIWPREQNMILRYDDYAKDMKTNLRDIFKFLELTKISMADINAIVDAGFSNIGKMYGAVGAMLPETEELLNKFYEPFILQFSEILGDTKFTWRATKPL